ncbi:FAD-dependent oxidoreductase [Pelagibaculum spongiae]|uniref:FAD-dependent oxidoreductase n=1 Tax=Pelagibaculum spongiae TaxID=2080658 RepID=A0A2V1GSR4_9GAMM|nr:FAD-dependent oxidoreductase [Pelagibaculum spongiae]PVZ65465.1 FAD-dependent oxidoreductase [Pelagibaculum spongiae]
MKLVLVGGGHAHALAARQLATGKFSQITLVSAPRSTPYSGMLPGLLAGHYQFAQAHIDLKKLADKYQFEFIEQRMSAIDCQNQQLTLDNGQQLDWDLLSLDTGSTPPLPKWFYQNESNNLVSIKPVEKFLECWQTFLEKLKQQPQWKAKIAVIGSGAGGIETLLALQYELSQRWPGREFEYCLIYRSSNVLAGHCSAVQSRMAKLLRQRHIHQVSGFALKQAEPDKLIAEDGRSELVDFSVVCTGAKAPSWATDSELDTCERGFVQVNQHLQSTSHPKVFAAGDIASIYPISPPKAGVYAVRQAPILTENLKQMAVAGSDVSLNNSESELAVELSVKLESYQAQQHFLSLLSCGDRYAIASWRNLALQGRWVWYWKDYIDRKFMNQFPGTRL